MVDSTSVTFSSGIDKAIVMELSRSPRKVISRVGPLCYS